MPVLKSDHARNAIQSAVVLDLGDIGRQAARLRADAEAKAQKILEDARVKADALIAGAEEKGFEQGRAAGLEQGLAEGREQGRAEGLAQMTDRVAQMQANWDESLGSWEAARSSLEAEARQTVIRFAVCLAEKLVHRTAAVDDTVIVDQVAAALAHVLRPTDVTVRICPGDRPILQEALPDLLARFDHLTHIHLVDDVSLTPAGCVVSYGQGRIDASIQTQLDRIVELMVPSRRSESSPDSLPDGPAASKEPDTESDDGER